MSLSVSRITHVGVYLAGGGLLGRAEKIELPTLTHKMSEHKGLGMIGALDLPDGIEKMEGTITWNSYYAEVLTQVADEYRTKQLQVRGSVDHYGSAGRIDQVPLLCTMSVMFKDLPMGSFEHQSPGKVETAYACYAAKMSFGDTLIFDYDVFANHFWNASEDLTRTFRINVG